MVIEYRLDETSNGTFHRYVWQQPSGAVYHLKFKVQKTDNEIKVIADKIEEDSKYDNEKPIYNENKREVLLNIMSLFEKYPNITLSQYNNYLQSLDWDKALELRHFIYESVKKLIEIGEITGEFATEGQMMGLLKNYIINTPKRKLAKIFLNQLDI